MGWWVTVGSFRSETIVNVYDHLLFSFLSSSPLPKSVPWHHPAARPNEPRQPILWCLGTAGARHPLRMRPVVWWYWLLMASLVIGCYWFVFRYQAVNELPLRSPSSVTQMTLPNRSAKTSFPLWPPVFCYVLPHDSFLNTNSAYLSSYTSHNESCAYSSAYSSAHVSSPSESP